MPTATGQEKLIGDPPMISLPHFVDTANSIELRELAPLAQLDGTVKSLSPLFTYSLRYDRYDRRFLETPFGDQRDCESSVNAVNILAVHTKDARRDVRRDARKDTRQGTMTARTAMTEDVIEFEHQVDL